ALARDGAGGAAGARNPGKVQEWLGEYSGLGERIVPTALDVDEREACDRTVEQLADKHGRLDILVNNAGITRDGLVMNMEDDQFDQVIHTNLRSAFWLTRAVSRHMVRARRGRIINITSISGIMGNAGQSNYSAAKAGMIGMTKAVAKELAKRGITCNAIAPGFIETDMTDVLPEKLRDDVKKLIPAQRFGTADEIAGVVVFLAGPAASYINGQVIVADGGLHM
ncbi:MAG: 3-oxoacyl-ACP reductase FabG, partial [Phycisphaerales bacterium]|nr:3-oxoacyl-ACP reductase FabG [Phycisphaerales bacterium]